MVVDDEVGVPAGRREAAGGRIRWVAVGGEENGLIKEQVWLRGEVLAEISYTRLMRLEKD